MIADLRNLILEVSSDHPNADYREIARHVAKLTPSELVAAFYEEALVSVVIEVTGASRRDSFPNSNKHPSPKVKERSAWWAKMLDERVAVEGGVKPLGDCGFDDLQAGKPAQPGSPLSPGHQHARAMRAMGKEILRDLWEEARRIHIEAS